MNIYILISKLYPWVGGAETQTETMIKEFVERGHHVSVLTRKFPGMEGRDYKGTEVKRVSIYSYPKRFHYLAHVIKFLIHLRKSGKKADVLLCMQLTPNGFVGTISRKLFGIPVVSYVRGNDWYLSKDQFFGRKIISYVLRNSDVVLVQTNKIGREIKREFSESNIKVVPNGISSYKKSTTGT